MNVPSFGSLISSRSYAQQIESRYSTNELTREEYRQLEETMSQVDVDYLAFTAPTVDCFSKPAITGLLQTSTGEVFRLCKSVKLYSHTNRYAIVLGKIGDYWFGLDDPRSSSTHTEGESEPVEASDRRIFSSINNSLASIVMPSATYQEIKDAILRTFPSERLVFYQFGQKVPLSFIQETLFGLSSEGHLEVALAVTFKLGSEMFLSAMVDRSYEKFCYSNFYSPKAVNIQLRSFLAANSFVENAYRLTVYNTFEHKRKRIRHQLKRKSGFIENQNLLSPYAESAKKTLNACRSSLRHLIDTELRLEGYFEIPYIYNP